MERKEIYTLMALFEESIRKLERAEHERNVLAERLYAELDKQYPLESNKSEA